MEETKRKLASIQKVLKLEPIEGADKIEKATILGWNVVVKKGEFKEGDLCIYFEVDSLLPIRKEYGFLQSGGVKRMNYDGKEIGGYRLKTVKLRGQISQGLALPIGTFPVELKVQDIWEEGKDVTQLLNVVKYEKPVPEGMVGKMRGNLPGFIRKTDEDRLQTAPKLLQKYKDTKFYVTEKLDGSSTSFFIRDGEFHVCSRSLDLFETPDNLIWKVAREMDIENKLKFGFPEGLVIQGEIVGGKIQGNPLKLTKPTIYFFNVFNYMTGTFYSYKDVVAILGQLGLPMVPVISEDFSLLPTVDDMVKFATRKSLISKDIWVEGCVFRPLQEIEDDLLKGRLSFKVINPEYLLERGE